MSPSLKEKISIREWRSLSAVASGLPCGRQASASGCAKGTPALFLSLGVNGTNMCWFLM